MNKEFVMRGQTASGGTEVLNFSGYKPGYAYRLVEFILFPKNNIGGSESELVGTVTARKTTKAPEDPDFNDEALIASALMTNHYNTLYPTPFVSVVNDTFLITQNLILMVQDTSGNDNAINWQCRFVAEKMNLSEEAVTNYKQFQISDGS